MTAISNFKFLISKTQKGFTLIELLVVISTLAVLSTVGIASFVSYSRQQSLAQGTFDLVSFLNHAKSRAGAQIKPTDASFCGQDAAPQRGLDGYLVRIEDDVTYRLYIQCEETKLAIEGQEKTLPNGTGTHNIIFPESTIGKEFLFKRLNGSVDFSSGATGNDTIDIHGFGNKCKQIKIYSNGKMGIAEGTIISDVCTIQ